MLTGAHLVGVSFLNHTVDLIFDSDAKISCYSSLAFFSQGDVVHVNVQRLSVLPNLNLRSFFCFDVINVMVEPGQFKVVLQNGNHIIVSRESQESEFGLISLGTEIIPLI